MFYGIFRKEFRLLYLLNLKVLTCLADLITKHKSSGDSPITLPVRHECGCVVDHLHGVILPHVGKLSVPVLKR